MKATELIRVKNLRGFDELGILKEGCDSSFSILPGEDIDEVLYNNGLNQDESSAIKVRMMRNNPHLVSLETKEEVKQKKEVDQDKDKENKRKEELSKLTKKEQIDFLVKLGVEKKFVPGMEPDRVNLIYELENKQ